MKPGDRSKFKSIIQQEFDAHHQRDHLDIIAKDQLLEGEDIIDSVWAMKRKWNILNDLVYKYKARLNLHEGQQKVRN